MRNLLLQTACALAFIGSAAADEGMWTFNNFPTHVVKNLYGFEPSEKWLDHMRLSSLRTPGWCSSSFVSPSGLVLTNHHCVVNCLEQLSTEEKNYIATPFVAPARSDERRCPDVELNQLIFLRDVTARMQEATKDLVGQEFKSALKAEMTKVEAECATTERDRCDVVELYRGGKYDLYKYHRYQDVRMVFAPEYAIGQFGGDLDNFFLSALRFRRGATSSLRRGTAR